MPLVQLARRRVAPVVAVCATASLIAACGDGGEEVASASPSPPVTAVASPPSPSPTPPPPPPPVEGRLTVSTLLAARPERLGTGSPIDPDRARATAAAEEVASALDAHLTAVQGGGDDLDALGAAWVGSPAERASLTTALGSAANPIAEAAYHVAVQWDDAPTTAAASVRLTRADGTPVAIDLLFDVGGDRPALVLFGAGAGAGAADGGGGE